MKPMTRQSVVMTWGILTASTAIVVQCGGTATDAADSGSSACERANRYARDCGATRFERPCPPNRAPDLECDAECDLEVSCAYFLGQRPAESRERSQCGARCSCESARRRSMECGIEPQFSCDQICNCGYTWDCETGIPAYAACRAVCPPWPEPTDASDFVDVSSG